MKTRTSVYLLLNLSLTFVFALNAFAGTHPRTKKKNQSNSEQAAHFPLQGQSSTILPNGQVLLLGGMGPDGPVATAALRDPQTGTITPIAGRLRRARAWHTATMLPDGTVLIFGGIDNDGTVLDIAESYDTYTQSFRPIPPPGLAPRAHHTATLLTDGLVFIVGGVSSADEVTGTAQTWDFQSNSLTSLSKSLLIPRRDQTATLLPDGTVLLWGGTQETGVAIPDGEVFDPQTGSFRIQVSQPPAIANQVLQLEATLPENDAQNVPLNTLIAVRFSAPVLVETVSAETLFLADPLGQAVPAKVVPAEAGMLTFLTPVSNLASGTNYTVGLSGITNPSGAPLLYTTFSFTTAGQSSGNGGGILGGDTTWTGGPENSPWRKLPPLEAAPGVTAISGQVLLLDGHPLAHVTLKVGTEGVETDNTGRFLLRDVPSGHVAMVIDGRTANRKGITYGVFEDGVDVTTGQTNVLNYTTWMPQIDTAHAVALTVPTTSEVVVTSPYLPGLEFHIPAGTTITDIDGKTVNQVSITPIPITQPPFPLPPGVNTPIYFTIQPGGGWIWVDNPGGPDGGWLVYPNSFHQPVGTRFDFWNYDPQSKGWYVYGHGSVSADGNSVTPDPGVLIYALTGAMTGPTTLAPSSGSGCGSWCQFIKSVFGGEPVDLGTGLFVHQKTDLYLPDIVPIQLTRTYRPNDSASRAFGVGATQAYDVFLVCGCYTYLELVLPDGSRIHYPRIAPGTSWPGSVFQSTSTPGPFFGSTIAWNGTGWTLTRRDGIVYKFPESSGATRGQQGALLSITDRNGNTLNITRDSNANATQVTSPNGRWVKLTYDTNFRVTQALDNAGRTVQYSYDSGGRLAKVTDANGGAWQYSYDANNNMTTLIDPRNITYLQNQYDSQNRVIKQILADGLSAYQFAYNPVPCGSNCSGIWETDVTDPNGNVRKVTFNAAPTFPSGFSTGGTASSVVYAAGTSVAQTATYQYQAGTNLLTGVTDALNRTTSFSFDMMGNTTTITRLSGTANAATRSYTYDPVFSQLTSATDELNHTTTFAYDTNGNLLTVTDPLGHSSTQTYNSAGQVASVADPLGNTINLGYLGGDLASITGPLGRTVSLFSDGAGRLTSLTDPLGNTTKYQYNPLNQITQIIDPLGGVTAFSYDANGDLLTFTDPKNTQNPTTYTYDTSDRLATRKDALGNQESYLYDSNGNLSQYTDRRGKITAFTYDNLNRRTFAGFGKSGTNYESTINYTLDAGNRMTQAVDSVTGTVARTYDGLNRLTQETTPQGSVSYGYDSASRRTSMTAGNQSAVTYSYDNASRLTQIAQGSTTVSFAYDSANRRTSLTLPNGIVVSYGYDTASELTGLTYTVGSNTLGNLTYTYDLAGRRTSMGGSYAWTNLPNAISTTAYDAANKLTQWGTATPSYDANGNMLSDGTNSYVWNARNRLASMNMSGYSFQYDPFGRRIAKTIIGTTTNFLYDGVNPVQEQSGGSVVANLLTGGVDEYFQRTDSSGTYSFLADALGSTFALTNSTGTAQVSYTYEPFGNTSITGSSASSYQFTGRENDSTGVYFYRGRYYSPTLQRFISEDPIGMAGGTNLYAYAANRPTEYTDPLGLDPRGADPTPLPPPPPPPTYPRPAPHFASPPPFAPDPFNPPLISCPLCWTFTDPTTVDVCFTYYCVEGSYDPSTGNVVVAPGATFGIGDSPVTVTVSPGSITPGLNLDFGACSGACVGGNFSSNGFTPTNGFSPPGTTNVGVQVGWGVQVH